MSDFDSAKAERRRAEAEKTQRDRKKYNITVGVIAGVIVLAVVFVVLFSSNLFYNVTTAVNVGGVKFSVADFNYNYFTSYSSYYTSQYNTYGEYASYYGLLPSTSSSFRDQTYWGGEDTTWADVFTDMAIERMRQVAMLSSEAEKAGFTLSQEDIDAVDASIEAEKEEMAAQGVSFKRYLTTYYGQGMTEKIFRENLLRDALASAYSESVNDGFTFTPDEITAHYAEHADEYDYFTYRVYSFSGAAVSDNADTEEDETVTAEDATAKAKADAEEFAASITSEQDFMDCAASLNSDNESYDADEGTIRVSAGSNLSSPIKEWLLDAARQPGDFDVVKTADDATTTYYYVVYFVGRDDNRYAAVNGRYILVPVDSTISADDYATTEEYDEAVKKAAEEAAAPMMTSFVNGSTHTEADFEAVAAANSTTAGTIASAGKNDLPDELSDWYFGSEHNEGDVGQVYVEGTGCYILFYSGSDGIYADLMSEALMRNDAYTEWSEGLMESYQAKRQWELKLATRITAIGG